MRTIDDNWGFSDNWNDPIAEDSGFDGIDLKNIISPDGSDDLEYHLRKEGAKMSGRKSGTVTEKEKAASSKRMQEQRRQDREKAAVEIPVDSTKVKVNRLLNLLASYGAKLLEIDHKHPNLNDPERYESIQALRNSTIKILKQLVDRS